MKSMVVSALLLLLFSAKSLGFTINIVESVKDKQVAKNLEVLLTNLYSPLGIIPAFAYYPSKRGLNMVDSGELDAEAIRLEMVGESYKNLVKVDQQMGTINAGFICIEKSNCDVDSNTVVAVISGFEGAVKICANLNLQCTFVDSMQAIAKMIDNGIADTIFATTVEIQYLLCAAKTNTFYFKQQQDQTLASYHYLNSKHIDLKPKLEAQLAKMKAEGKMESDTPLKDLLATTCNKSVSIIE